MAYYKSIVDHDGGLANVVDYRRCFLVPGFGHILGGPGFQDIGTIGIAAVPFGAEHNPLLAMKAWVQEGRAPERILPVAFEGGQFGGTIVAERPVYPYPTTTEYIAGDPRSAESYGPSEV